MSSAITEHDPSRQTRSRAETKAEMTDRSFRTITVAEVERRDVKTARLRQARLEMEAVEAERPAPVKVPRARAAAQRRTKPTT